MNIINWSLERAAEELTWANRAQVWLSADPQKFALVRESVEEWRHTAGMHIASANALADKRAQIRPDDAIVKQREVQHDRLQKLLASEHQEVSRVDPYRCTGRSTALVFKLMGKAMQEPGQWHQIKDHHPSGAADRHLAMMIAQTVTDLGLKFFNFHFVDHKCYVSFGDTPKS